MKRLILILVFVVAIFSGMMFTQFVIIPYFQSPPSSVNENPELANAIGLPVKLEISKINVTASLEYVGLDKDGNMDSPKDTNNVAWYQLGPPPGVKGSSVMAGHYDSLTGPAIFFNLANLEPGDSIVIVDNNNTSRTFTVERKEVYEETAFPINEVFTKDDKVRLNLITCKGRFNRVTLRYPQRVVIYAVLGKCVSKVFNRCIIK